MKSYSSEVYQMGNAFLSWAKTNETKLKGFPAAWEIVTAFQETHSQLDLNIGVQGQNQQKLTVGKEIRRETVVTNLLGISNLLYNDTQKKGNSELATEMKTSRARLNKLSTTTLINLGKERVQNCRDRGEQLAETGITAEMVTALEESINDYQDFLTKPVEVRKRKKVATKQIDQGTSKLLQLIRDRMTLVMQSLFADEPEFLAEYEAIVEVEKAPTYKLAVMGSIRNAETGEAVVNCWLEIPGTDIAYRATGKKGQFRIQNLEPGIYTLTCTHTNYHPNSVEFSHAWGQTNRLIIDLRMTETAREEKQKLEEHTKTRK